jgi:hypothetical protein
MKYRSSTEGEEIVKKDYRKKIIFSPDDFDEPGHLLQVVMNAFPSEANGGVLHPRRGGDHHDQRRRLLPDSGMRLSARPAMCTIYGIKQRKSSGRKPGRECIPIRSKRRCSTSSKGRRPSRSTASITLPDSGMRLSARPAMCTIYGIKHKEEFRLRLVFKINLPEEGEDSYWHE